MTGDTFEPAPSTGLSLIDALAQGLTRSRDVLFRPFRPDKWLVLAFCAWLAGLGRGGGSGVGNTGWQEDANPDRIEDGVHHAWDWMLAHLLLFVTVFAILLLAALALWVLVLWLSSRGKFMFLDGVVQDRAAVVEPWHRYRTLANSLFGFRVVVSLLVLFVLAFVFALLGAIAALSGMTDPDVTLPILIAVCLVMLIVFFVVAMLLLGLAIDDFIVPIMYLRECPVTEAWRELGRLVGLYPGSFLLYVLIKILISIVVATIEIVACCMTCCLVLIPYVGTVILLPIHLFLRAFPLYLLGQCGSGYERFARMGMAEREPATEGSGGEA